MKHDTKADTLRQWKAKGVESLLLDARLKYTDAEGFHRYASMLAGVDIIHPDMLPTQASGRWSTTGPPLTNFPPSMDDVLIPMEGFYFIGWDMEAIEGRIGSAYMRDKEDLEAYNNGWDIHTITACRAWKRPLPPFLDKRVHKDPECQEWREGWKTTKLLPSGKEIILTPEWQGKDDRRRHLAKIARYCYQYVNPVKGQERAILTAKDIEKQGLDRSEMLDFGKRYLATKIGMTNFKIKLFKELNERGVARTIFGRRRRLYGEYATKGKEGWSFMVSGSVSDLMNQSFIRIANVFPEASLVKNGHDSGLWQFPESTPVDHAVQVVKGIVNQTWDVNGVKIYCPGEFYVVSDDGTKVSA